jgi:hypothetical protein
MDTRPKLDKINLVIQNIYLFFIFYFFCTLEYAEVVSIFFIPPDNTEVVSIFYIPYRVCIGGYYIIFLL